MGASPSTWTPKSVLMDVRVGDWVMVGRTETSPGERGQVVHRYADPQYPMEIAIEGDSSGRTVRPIFYRIGRVDGDDHQ